MPYGRCVPATPVSSYCGSGTLARMGVPSNREIFIFYFIQVKDVDALLGLEDYLVPLIDKQQQRLLRLLVRNLKDRVNGLT